MVQLLIFGIHMYRRRPDLRLLEDGRLEEAEAAKVQYYVDIKDAQSASKWDPGFFFFLHQYPDLDPG